MTEVVLQSAEDARLDELHSLRQLDTPRQMMFDRLIFIAAQLFRAPMAALALVDKDRVWFKAKVGFAVSEIARSGSFCEEAILSDEVLIVEDARSDVRFSDYPLVAGAPFIRSYVGAPLITAGGLRIGTLSVFDTHAREPDPRCLTVLPLLALTAVQRMYDIRPTSPNEERPLALGGPAALPRAFVPMTTATSSQKAPPRHEYAEHRN